MTKTPSEIDIHIGALIRLRRMMSEMSQENLGEELNLTFQQVQKYEKGANRVAASKLYKIAQIFGVPVGFFFEGLPGLADRPVEGDETADVLGFVHGREGLKLNTAFAKIENPETRASIVSLVESLVV